MGILQLPAIILVASFEEMAGKWGEMAGLLRKPVVKAAVRIFMNLLFA
jgi:hypothetical protein